MLGAAVLATRSFPRDVIYKSHAFRPAAYLRKNGLHDWKQNNFY